MYWDQLDIYKYGFLIHLDPPTFQIAFHRPSMVLGKYSRFSMEPISLSISELKQQVNSMAQSKLAHYVTLTWLQEKVNGAPSMEAMERFATRERPIRLQSRSRKCMHHMHKHLQLAVRYLRDSVMGRRRISHWTVNEGIVQVGRALDELEKIPSPEELNLCLGDFELLLDVILSFANCFQHTKSWSIHMQQALATRRLAIAGIPTSPITQDESLIDYALRMIVGSCIRALPEAAVSSSSCGKVQKTLNVRVREPIKAEQSPLQRSTIYEHAPHAPHLTPDNDYSLPMAMSMGPSIAPFVTSDFRNAAEPNGNVHIHRFRRASDPSGVHTYPPSSCTIYPSTPVHIQPDMFRGYHGFDTGRSSSSSSRSSSAGGKRSQSFDEEGMSATHSPKRQSVNSVAHFDASTLPAHLPHGPSLQPLPAPHPSVLHTSFLNSGHPEFYLENSLGIWGEPTLQPLLGLSPEPNSGTEPNPPPAVTTTPLITFDRFALGDIMHGINSSMLRHQHLYGPSSLPIFVWDLPTSTQQKQKKRTRQTRPGCQPKMPGPKKTDEPPSPQC